MIIYKAHNTINGMVYIGQTVESLNARINRHLSYGKSFFPLALRHYGRSAFTFEIIDRASTREELDEKERYWIAFYNCLAPLGYNLTEGGGGSSGWKAPDHVREKVSVAKKGKSTISPEGRAALRDFHTGRTLSPDARAKVSAANKGRVFSPEHRAKLAESNRRRAAKRRAQVGETRGSH